MKTLISVVILRKSIVSPSPGSVGSLGLALSTWSLLVLAGCSSGVGSKPQVQAISFTDANGAALKPLTSLTVSQGTYVTVSLTADSQLLGADWSIACGSALLPGTPLPPGQTQDESCGTFTPAHTMSGPIPSYVTSGQGYVAFYTAPAVPPKQGTITLFASATSDHSRFASVSLAIGGLPISVGFAPAPSSTLGGGASTQLKAVLTNDATGAGVNWSVICGSSACGSFSPTQTTSGVVTTYTAPTAIPTGGTVKVTATSAADPTKAVSATIQIVPISLSVTPTALTVGTAGTGSLVATVVNDASNKGVDWTLNCTNTTSPGNCGTISPHTLSGATATYTAPSIANIGVGSTIVLTATSSTDPTKSAASTVTTIKGSLITGSVQAVQRPVAGAEVTLYAAMTSETLLHGDAIAHNASALVTAMTQEDGSFSIPYGYECQTPNTPMYLISTGGNAGGGTNANLALIATLGSCSDLDASRVVVNEATTVAAAYALVSLMDNSQHVGSIHASSDAVAIAFATSKDLVDVTTGLPRAYTVSGKGQIPQAKVNALESLAAACAMSGGSTRGDGSACDQFFQATNPGVALADQPGNTIQALVNLARNANGFANHPASFTELYRLSTSHALFSPVLSSEPVDWTLAIQFHSGQGRASTATPRESLQDASITSSTGRSIDAAGNVWAGGSGSDVTEFVGAATCIEVPKPSLPSAADSRSTQ